MKVQIKTKMRWECLLSKSQKIRKGCQEHGKRVILAHSDGNVTGKFILENNMDVPQKLITAIWSDNSTFGFYPEKMKSESWRDTYMLRFIALLFILGKIRNILNVNQRDNGYTNNDIITLR